MGKIKQKKANGVVLNENEVARIETNFLYIVPRVSYN